MPELPEVETVVRQLDKVLSGRVIKDIEVLREKSAMSDLGQVEGKKIKKVTRKQKMIVMEFKESDLKLLVHLKMTGQLIYDQNLHELSNKKQSDERVVGGHPSSDWVDELPSSHTRIIITFKDKSKLFFNDQRVFGWMKVVDEGGWENIVNRLPPDVVDEAFTKDYLVNVLSRSGRAVKLVILDQQKMGGMGNIYANDALWLSRINPKENQTN